LDEEEFGEHCGHRPTTPPFIHDRDDRLIVVLLYMGTPEKRPASTQRTLEKKAGNTQHETSSMGGLPSHSKLAAVDSTTLPLVHKAGAGCRTRQKMGQQEAEQLQNLLSAHHQEGHGNRGFRAVGLSSHDQPEGILAFTRSKDSLDFVSTTLVGTELLFLFGIDLRVLWRPSQSLARQRNSMPGSVVPVLGVDIDAVCTDTLWIAVVLLLILFGLSNQIITFVVGIPADPM